MTEFVPSKKHLFRLPCHFSKAKAGFTPRRQVRQGCKIPPPPSPPHRGGEPANSPPWIRRGQGWLMSAPILCFHRHSRFVPPFFIVTDSVSRLGAKCAKTAKSHHPQPLLIRGGESANSPPWIRRGQGWSITTPVVCIHQHSGFVPSISCSMDRRICGPRPVLGHGRAASDRRTGGLRYQTA